MEQGKAKEKIGKAKEKIGKAKICKNN